MNVPPVAVTSQEGPQRIDVAAVNSAQARTLYQKRVQIYPKLVHGRFRTLKWAAMVALLAIYYITPWLRWSRGAGAVDQAVMVDFAGRRFYFFFIELWPQEVYYITGLLILAAVGIFLSSALFGRIWCGYACPQTVWTDLYLHVERLIEGDRSERLRLAKAGWSIDKLSRKLVKHVLWIVIAAATGGAWVFYFGDAPTLFLEIFSGAASIETYLFVGLLTFMTYTLAGTMREQVCTYMCPWPRIQAAMTDAETLSVTYRADRGEPRGAHKKGVTWEGRGDCIDCNQCVAACPQGIDIRDGDQLECINCALCIDACDTIMQKIERPRGLIAYDTKINVTARQRGEKTRFRFIRPRTILYAVVFALVGAIMLTQLINRPTVSVDVSRDRSPAYVRLADGSIRNNYQIKIINKLRAPQHLVLALDDTPGALLSMFGQDGQSDYLRVVARGDSVTTVRIHVTEPAALNHGIGRVRFVLRDADGAVRATHRAAFVGSDP